MLTFVKSKTCFLAIAISLLCGTAHAQWLLLDDFETATAGAALNGTTGPAVTWEGGATHLAVVDTGDASNQVMQILGDQLGERLRGNFTDPTNNIATGTTGTVFYRFRTADIATGGTSDSVVGLTDNSAISNFNFKAGLRLTSSPVLNNLDVRTNNAVSGSSEYQQIGGLASSTWYSIWIVADNTSGTAGTFTLYLQSDTDPNFATQTQLQTAVAMENVFDYRINGATDIVNIYFRTGNSGSTGTEIFYDDIYINNSAVDLTDPRDSTVLLGDVDLSGEVNFLDIAPFILLLSGNGYQLEADIDMNDLVTFLDIGPFITILSGG